MAQSVARSQFYPRRDLEEQLFRPRKSSPAENQNAAGLQIITFYKIAAGRYELLSKATNIMLSKSK